MGRNYYRCKNWPWYQFYMVVVGASADIRKKKEEEERRRIMAEGFEKLAAAVGEKVAAREKVQAVNEGLKAKLAVIKADHAKEMEVSGAIAADIKTYDQKAAAAAVALQDLEVTINSERKTLQADLKYAKEVMSQDKVNMAKELADMKDKVAGASGGYQGLKNRAIAAEADKVALRGEVACVKKSNVSTKPQPDSSGRNTKCGNPSLSIALVWTRLPGLAHCLSKTHFLSPSFCAVMKIGKHIKQNTQKIRKYF